MSHSRLAGPTWWYSLMSGSCQQHPFLHPQKPHSPGIGARVAVQFPAPLPPLTITTHSKDGTISIHPFQRQWFKIFLKISSSLPAYLEESRRMHVNNSIKACNWIDSKVLFTSSKLWCLLQLVLARDIIPLPFSINFQVTWWKNHSVPLLLEGNLRLTLQVILKCSLSILQDHK